jgi:hypothetical protein
LPTRLITTLPRWGLDWWGNKCHCQLGMQALISDLFSDTVHPFNEPFRSSWKNIVQERPSEARLQR